MSHGFSCQHPLTAALPPLLRISPPASQEELKSLKEKQLSQEMNAPVSQKQPEGAQYYFTEEEKKRFRDDPEYHLRYRQGLEQEVNSVFSVFIKDSTYSKHAEESMKAEMLRRIGPGHDDLKEKLIPVWPPGCMCPTFLI